MTEPPDKVDDWLGTEVTPLSPPPGAMDRIRRRARQRKMRQVVVAAAGCAVVLAAAVTAPQLLAGTRPSGASQSVAGGQHSALPSSQVGSTGTPGAEGSGSPQPQPPPRTRLSVTNSGAPVPEPFHPTSVTFVGNGQGGLVGAVIGQAGPPCANPADCTSLAGTSDYGKTWYGVSAPVAPGPTQATGVSQLRFSNLLDGWAYGPALYETTDGGWPWSQVNTDGQVVTALEASGQTAFAVFANCSPGAAGFAADCTSFTLYSGAAGSTTWNPVTVPAGYQNMSASQPSSAGLVISAGIGYLLTPSGAVLSGPVPGGAWTLAGQAPCQPGAAQAATGAPSGAQLAAYQGQLVLTCPSQEGGTSVYTSSGGAAWQLVGKVPGPGIVTGLASVDGKEVVAATTAGISYSTDEGVTWHSASISGGNPTTGFSYVGMTSASLGVAVPADANLGAVYVTHDGGQTWSKSPITG